MITVYHAFLRDPKSDHPSMLFFPTVEKVRAVFLGTDPDYCVAKVAEVDTDDLDKAYDKRWQENAGVTPYYPAAKRSTSVGDVLLRSDGEAYAVASFGFRSINYELDNASEEHTA
jgi:hypothetical protein